MILKHEWNSPNCKRYSRNSPNWDCINVICNLKKEKRQTVNDEKAGLNLQAEKKNC